MGAARYAIYAAPAADSALWHFGSALIGYDAATGLEPAQLVPRGWDAPAWHAATIEPRRYGFHGTLKAPFSLADGRGEDELCAALDSFAQDMAAFDAGAVSPRLLGSFIALTPDAPCQRLNELADRAVGFFEPFRAPISAADRARRLQTPLTPRQTQQLDRFGYPYVFADFRFHMTLSGALDEELRAPTLAAIEPLLATHVSQARLVLEDICLFRQPARDQRFHILKRVSLHALRA